MSDIAARWLGLEGARGVVVGAGGLGGAIATGLAGEGAAIGLIDVREDRLSGASDVATATRCVDAADPVACEHAVSGLSHELGGLDVLVHAVGINVRESLDATDPRDVRRLVEVNLESALWSARAAARAMRPRGGRIVVLSSAAARIARPAHGVYGATKAGLDQLVRVMAVEWAPDDIAVNALAPGYADTALTRSHLERPGVRDALVEGIPLRRLATVEDIVDSALFLCSRRSAFITGQTLLVDGGESLT